MLRTLLAAALGLALVPTLPTAAQAAQAVAAEPAPGRLLLVLDSSGSMKEQASGGGTKIAAAKAALGEVVDNLPANQDVGLRVYGAEVFSRNDQGACTDSQLVVPIESDNRADLKAAIKKYKPYGETPIGHALKEAAKDLGGEGRRHIVLVSDGEPTCEPDPCQVAADLAQQGIDLTVDVVGLDVSAKARTTLECVAAAARGTYYSASSQQDLVSSLSQIQARSARAYEPIGEPVVGTYDPDTAPLITAGDWVDSTRHQQRDVFYRVRRDPSATLMIGSAFEATEAIDFVTLELLDDTGERCAVGVRTGGESLRAAGIALSPLGPPYREECLAQEELVLHVDYAAGGRMSPLELKVTEVATPPTTDAAPTSSNVAWTAPERTTPVTPVTGGTSFADPEPIELGTHSGRIVPGETLTFTVPAEWGQQVAATARVKATQYDSPYGPGTLQTSIFSPSRVPVGAFSTTPQTEDGVILKDGEDQEVSAITPVITIGNLTQAKLSADRWGASIAGDHTVTVSVRKGPSDTSVAIPFELDVDVIGEAVDGPDEVLAPPTPSESTEAEESASAGATPSEDADDQTAPPAEEAEEATEDDGISPVSFAIGGAGIVVLLLAGALLLIGLRRRRS